MTTKVVVGIDPGLRGGIVCLGWGEPKGWKMPIMEGPSENKVLDCLQFMEIVETFPGHALFYVELPFAIPGQALRSTSTTFENYGRLLACLEVLERPYGLIRPQEWQSRVAELTRIGKDAETRPKVRARIWARCFPGAEHIEFLRGAVPHDGLVDAFLIAKSQGV